MNGIILTRLMMMGRKDGHEFASRMDYDDFQEALRHKPLYVDVGQEVYVENTAFRLNGISSAYFLKYQEGFLKGIQEFWDKVKNYL